MSPENNLEEQRQLRAMEVFQQGLTSVRDLLAPSALEIAVDHLKLGQTYLTTLFVYDYPRMLFPGWLSQTINTDLPLDVSIHIYPQDNAAIAQKLRGKSTQLESTLDMNAQRGLVRDPGLEAKYLDVENLREKIATGQTKIFKVGFYLTIYSETLELLNDSVDRVEKMLNELLVYSKRTLYQGKEGFNSTLPLDREELSIGRNLDTEAISTFFPFLSDTLSQDTGVFYGINKINNSLIIFDRFSLPNYNSVVIAMSGAGKSFTVKLELIRSLILGTDILVIDPENEYEELSKAFGGSYLNININSDQHVNPFDLPLIDDEKEAIESIRSNTIMLAGLVKVMVGNISPEESNILDKAVIESYASRGITEDPKTHGLQPPTFHDLQKVLESINGGESIAIRLDKYTNGTYAGLMNQQSNVSMENRLVVFSIRDLEEELRPIAMYSILNFIWNKIKSVKKKRLLFVDEAWVLMKFPESAQFLFSLAKRGRKYYLGLTCIAQDAADFFGSEYGRAIAQNSSMAILLRQHPAQVDYVKEAWKLTETERDYLVTTGVGEGLFIAGLRHVAMQIIPSYQENLLANTNPEKALKVKEDE